MGIKTSILLCSPVYGGCGHVGKSTEWDSDPDHNYLECPVCGDDHAFQLTRKNFDSLTKGLCALQVHTATTLLAEYYGN